MVLNLVILFDLNILVVQLGNIPKFCIKSYPQVKLNHTHQVGARGALVKCKNVEAAVWEAFAFEIN